MGVVAVMVVVGVVGVVVVVVGGGGWWWVVGGVESNFSITFGPNLKTKTFLRPRPKLTNISHAIRFYSLIKTQH